LAFREYRRRQGNRTSILPDFLIAAQADMRGWRLLTKDRKGFESYFPNIILIDPKKAQND
jgi:predicted nucleic acid-binding protein